jgi:phosphoserine aminotransferase
MEMAMWSLLGERPVDVFSWESFGQGWLTDIQQQLRLDHCRSFTAGYGELPDLSRASPDHDVVFTWNGTTSGVRVPDGDWISAERGGLTICDATSAVFALPLPWEKLDVVTFSWQKVLGGEGAHGVLILSPRAVERLEQWTPPWPMPKVFRLTKNGKLIEGIFKGATINTPSMLCVADYLDALGWVRSMGGQQATIQRCRENLAVIEAFVGQHDWIDFLATDPAIRSNTSVCLVLDLDDEQVRAMVHLLDEQSVAHDIGAYRDAPAGLRIWCGSTVEKHDVELLMPWLEWAYWQVKE